MRTANLLLASVTAEAAKFSLHPFISKRIWPARTAATQYFTDPFPLPIRTSSGFFVMGKDGKVRIQIFACFFKYLLKSRRTDSI